MPTSRRSWTFQGIETGIFPVLGGAVNGDAGAGLGLPIARAVAARHGGAVDASPRQAGGLEVRLTLPAGQ